MVKGEKVVAHERTVTIPPERGPGGPFTFHRSPFSGLLAASLLLLSCRGTLSPLSNKLDIGEEAYLVFTADGEDGQGDLFASTPAGGTVYQVTFTRVDERLTALSPDGMMVAFVRARSPSDDQRWLIVMNLLNGAERQVEVRGIVPEATGWAPDGRRIYLRSGKSVQVTEAPPGRLELREVLAPEQAAADSALAVVLGDPAIGMVVPCATGGICVRFPGDTVAMIAAAASSPVRWAGDSLAYLDGGAWTVRPLSGGRTRILRWSRPIRKPRDLTLYRGRARR
jgi:hypothetical protein